MKNSTRPRYRFPSRRVEPTALVPGLLLLVACVGSPESLESKATSLQGMGDQFESLPGWDFTDVWEEWNVLEDNRAPVAGLDRFDATEETTLEISVQELLANDYDPERREMWVTDVEDVFGGQVEMDDGVIRFTPETDFASKASFSYTLSDGVRTSRGMAEVRVAGVNDPPVPGTDRFTTAEDTPLVLTVAELIGNDSDPDEAATLWVSGVGGATNGVVSTTYGRMTFHPKANYWGDQASFEYALSDGDEITVGTVSIDVTEVTECGDGERDPKFNAESMTFRWLAAGCGGANQIGFTVDGVEVLGTEAGDYQHACSSRIRSATLTAPEDLARISGNDPRKVNFGVAVSADSVLAWAIVDIVSDKGEHRRVVIADEGGGDDGLNTNDNFELAGAAEGLSDDVDEYFGEECDGEAGCTADCRFED